jgi:hypothetical protein
VLSRDRGPRDSFLLVHQLLSVYGRPRAVMKAALQFDPSLEHAGRRDLAARTRDMPNLLPPRPRGAMAAIRACPDANVIFMVHAWAGHHPHRRRHLAAIPGRPARAREVVAGPATVRPGQVPRAADYEAQAQWLYG